MLVGGGSPYNGIRIKSFEAPTRRRGLRTLDLFVGELGDGLTDGFRITLPKVTSVDQVAAMVTALEVVESAHGLRAGSLLFEIRVETPQAILGADGSTSIARMIRAGDGRVTGLHYRTYDYSASPGVAAEQQSMEHPVADHAKDVMQVAAAGTGVFVSDGSSNRLPVGDSDAKRAAWALHLRLVRRSLERGIHRGWDLHPAQLPSRFASTYAFFRDGLPSAATRLRAYVHGGQSGYLDEPATAAALAGFLLRGLECGAVDAGRSTASSASIVPSSRDSRGGRRMADLDLVIRAERVISSTGEVGRQIGIKDGTIVAIEPLGSDSGRWGTPRARGR
ncbi:DUF6986 family protein [Nocardioides sp. B-3]|uniref:DUF6986 family protein n=1 Tax=Nocardioides sp. B-3 TaxID=2895565 RepID=UPI002153318E|nr:hypothetical protein [Nocardioides sp. B-3]UUZ58682.1 hypothetical protein LP418_21590 [Nocardioides sp. B-3]